MKRYTKEELIEAVKFLNATRSNAPYIWEPHTIVQGVAPAPTTEPPKDPKRVSVVKLATGATISE
jgi:hypothetical protein